MNKINVSIIIPIYKVEKYLKECIDSVLVQTFKNFELILVNDGSPDNCGAICDEYAKKDNRIKVIHKENGGVSSARNAGLKIAQGDFINFIDGDDTIPKDSIENLVNLQKENDADFVCCTYEMYNKHRLIKRYYLANKFIEFSKIEDDDVNVLLSSLLRGPCTKLFKREILDSYNILFNENVCTGEDTIFVYDYLSKCKRMQCGDIVVYNYLRNDQSASARVFEKFYSYMIKMVNSQCGFFDSLNIIDSQKKFCKEYVLLISLGYVVTHYLTHYSFNKALEMTSKVFNCYENLLKEKDVEFELFLKKVTQDKTLVSAYKILTLKNGVKKYCKYKYRLRKVAAIKTNLKKIKILNDLNNWLKGRK